MGRLSPSPERTAPAPEARRGGPDGTIIYATSAPATGLQRVSAAGGEPTVLTKPDRERGEADHVWPEFLPGGDAVLFTITPTAGAAQAAQIAVLDLRTGTSKVLIRGGSHASFVATGHLVYAVAGTLRAVAFDLERLEVMGTPVPVLEGVSTSPGGAPNAAVATNGSLVYVPGAADRIGQLTVVAVDRQGRASPVPGIPPDAYLDIRVSPDGRRLALANQTDVWTYEFERATFSRLTTHAAPDTRPMWTPDGRRIIYRSDRGGLPELFSRPSDGTGDDERLLSRSADLIDLRVTGWSADGRQLLVTEVSPTLQCTIGQAPAERPSDLKILVKDEFCNDWAVISPDGRWMAYASNRSGRNEVYVERYPELGNRLQISTAGGHHPSWSRDGRELYFRGVESPDRQMFAVPVRSAATLVAGRPQLLFESTIAPVQGGARAYDVTPDGRFIIISRGTSESGEGPAASLTLVLNWFEELKRLVPR